MKNPLVIGRDGACPVSSEIYHGGTETQRFVNRTECCFSPCLGVSVVDSSPLTWRFPKNRGRDGACPVSIEIAGPRVYRSLKTVLSARSARDAAPWRLPCDGEPRP